MRHIVRQASRLCMCAEGRPERIAGRESARGLKYGLNFTVAASVTSWIGHESIEVLVNSCCGKTFQLLVTSGFIAILMQRQLLAKESATAEAVPAPPKAEHTGSNVYDQSWVGPLSDGRVIVPTNQILAPAGRQVLVSGRPTDVA